MNPASFKSRPFHGWFIVAAVFVITFVGFGSAYTFSAFIESLQRDFGASRGSVSLVFSLAGFLYFSLGAISGPLADRWGARRLTVLGMALIALGLVLASVARSLGEVYAAYCLGVGLGVGFAYVPAVGVIQRWFVRRRGVASGLAVSGIGVGTLVMPPFASYLIGVWEWREAYLILGAFAAVFGIAASLAIEDDPCTRGLEPDGDARQTDISKSSQSGMSVREAVRSPKFMGLYIACLICSFGVFVPFVHLVPYALGHGIAQSSAVLLLGAIGAGSTVGRFFLGGIADRMGRAPFLLTTFVGMAFALAIWAVANGIWALAVFALLFGLFYGGWVAILPAVVADYFGGRNASGIIGILYTSVAVGTLIGPSATGFIFDVSHSYTVPIIASVGANVCAAIIAAFVARASKPRAASVLS